MKKTSTIFVTGADAFPKREPLWWFRYGMPLILGLFLLLLYIGLVIPYPHTLGAETVLRTDRPSLFIKSRLSKAMESIPVRSGDTVQEGAILAILRNTASLDDVLGLKKHLALAAQEPADTILETIASDGILKLGDGIQKAYQRYVQAAETYAWQHKGNMDHLALRDWEQRWAQAKTAQIQQWKALELANKELELAHLSYDRFQQLHAKGIISDQEREIRENEYLSVLKGQEAAVHVYQMATGELKQLKAQKQIAETTLMAQSQERVTQLAMARQELWSAIEEWEERHVLRSPIAGRIVFIEDWQPGQYPIAGKPAFAVIPLGEQRWYAHCRIKLKNSGKLEQGQNVLVELDNYPVREHGYLTGAVERISEVPLDNTYSVRVVLDSERSDASLKLGHGMQGRAKIIIEDTRLLERIFYGLRHAFTDGTRSFPEPTKKP